MCKGVPYKYLFSVSDMQELRLAQVVAKILEKLHITSSKRSFLVEVEIIHVPLHDFKSGHGCCTVVCGSRTRDHIIHSKFPNALNCI